MQLEKVYPDSKTFVDALPVRDPAVILEQYREARGQPGFDLKKFVTTHFTPPPSDAKVYQTVRGQDVREHIDTLWTVLERKPEDQRPYTSRIALPDRYIVPGGRFNEIYYWDSYFTMLGLEESGRHDLTVAMVHNFAWLIDQYGHIPNGNRTYFLSRSQPPFFSHMVELAAELEGEQVYATYLPQMQREHAYWMAGSEQVEPGSARDHVVVLPDGTILNRYWDALDTPRDEAYLHDVQTAREAPERAASQVYRDLRAAAESGMDFSSRWLDDGRTLATIRTTAILPVDLNCFLYVLERQIGRISRACGKQQQAEQFQRRAQLRRTAIERWLWSESAGAFLDRDLERGRAREGLNAAVATPLFVELASAQQAQRTAAAIESRLLREGGIGTSESASGQQWDRPNGWAPLQWMAISGLRGYGIALGEEIATRWLKTVSSLYKRESKLVEKYAITRAEDGLGGHGGEYPLQDGFGWTNGVLRHLLALYPKLASVPGEKSRGN